MSTEIELKYLLPEEGIDNEQLTRKINDLLITQNFEFEYSEKLLVNDYFDSKSLDLRKMDIGLRIRNQAGKYEQTIKTAGKVISGLHQRPEYNINIENNQLALALFPKHIWPENIDVAMLQQKSQVIFSTNFTRQAWLINYNNNMIELALDKGFIHNDSCHQPVVINEIEIELVTGEQASLFSLAEQLKTLVSLKPGNYSKAARGYALVNNR